MDDDVGRPTVVALGVVWFFVVVTAGVVWVLRRVL